MTSANINIKTPVTLDDILVKFSILGRYYLGIMPFLFIAYLSNSLFCSNYVFTAEEVVYRCKDERFANNTCSSLSNSTEFCTEWVYDNPNSFMAEFQLACQEWKRTLVGTVHSFGYMMGLLIVGPLSDRIGRKKTIAVVGLIGGILGVAKSFTTWYWMYIVLEFLEAAIGDICSPLYMLNVEMVSHEKRLQFQLMCGVGYAFGFSILPLSAWLIPYWRNMLRVIYTPAMLFIFYIFLLDESPRWLISRGEKEAAIAIIQKVAKTNKVKIEDNLLENLSYEHNKGVKFSHLLKETFTSKALLTRFLICLTWWIASTFVNYGLQINAVSLHGNKYVDFALITVVEIFALVVVTYVLLRFRRKMPLLCSFFLASILCLAQPFIPNNINWLAIFLYMIGKLMATMYFYITYMYTCELFPTYTRNCMHALCSSIGRIGSIIAPQTPLLMVYWEGLPSLVFGLVSLCAGLATLCAPDTADRALPDSVRQAEEIH